MMREPLRIHYIQYGGIPDVSAFAPHSTYRPDQNVKIACENAGISLEDARGASRCQDIVCKRYHVMAILRSWGRSMPQIGRALNRDHTTVLHGLHRWEDISASRPVTPAGAVRG